MRLAYVFGSAAGQDSGSAPNGSARGARRRKPADVDLAYLPGPTFRFPAFYADVSAALGTDRLDLVDLRMASPGLLFQIIGEGRVLHRESVDLENRFEHAVLARVRDEAIRLRRAEEACRRGGKPVVLREDAVRRQLLELETVAAELEKYAGVTADDLRRDLSLRWTVERGLLAGLTLLFNVADHILSSAFQRHPERYEDALTELAGCGVLPVEVRRELTGAGGFRNILVHEYVRIDLEEVARSASSAPAAFRAFARAVRAWLDARRDRPEPAP
ncbi:MAG: DUF86 domain-containing protein [Clostridia bacterium]|nr:DUF86 domain-containing protein [Clostridia bacterium]